MGWFRRSDDTEPALVSVLDKDASSVAGAGALLSPCYVLTCAHVVSLALGKDKENTERPTDSARFSVELHDGPVKHLRTARLSVWLPPRPSPGSRWGEGDLAVLELDEPAGPSTRAVVWEDMAEGLDVRAWHGVGERMTGADTTIQGSTGYHYYADAFLSGASIQEGYSGSPLCRKDERVVAVGLVTNHVISNRQLSDTSTVRRTLAVPWQRIQKELDREKAHHVLAACLPASFSDMGNVPDNAVDLLLKLFESDDQLERCARLLARELGYRLRPRGSVPAALSLEEELAVLLFTEEHAVATLAELLAGTARGDQRKTLNELLALGSLEGVRLLSGQEYQELLGILRRVNSAHPRLFCRAVRHVLRLSASPPTWFHRASLADEELATAVQDLEKHYDPLPQDDDTRLTPRLLEIAVLLAVAVADKRTSQELDAWCAGVRRRLDTPASLLVEWRVRASSWVKSRQRQVTRVTVDLVRADPERERYECRVWLMSEGWEPERVEMPDGPHTAEEIGRKIHKLAKEHHNGGGEPAPWIDVVVGRDDLHVPVDAWTAGSVLDRLAELDMSPLPGQSDESWVLGAKYRVALRLREFSQIQATEGDRRSRLRRRWEAGHSGPLVIRGDATGLRDVLDTLDEEHSETAWAVLHGGPENRNQLLHVCLALGVPVVLWDREAASLEHAQRLEKIVGSVSLSDLPEVVQGFRKAVYHEEKPFPARPAMVWDDPNMPLPPSSPDHNDPPDAPRNSGRMTAR